ncbi:MAG: hypothetical protein ACR2OZ_10740 [Verrucomicrobiales bacterium]
MKVAKKSSEKRDLAPSTRATLTLKRETYGKIDALRGRLTRSAWVQGLIDHEEARQEREQFVRRLSEEYTPKVVSETLAVNDQYPIHEG